MKVLPVAIAVALLVSSAAAWAQIRSQPARPTPPPTAAPPPGEMTERLLLVPPQGWKTAGSGGSKTTLTTQMFPGNESSDNWTEMLSVQVVADGRADPRDHIQRIVEASRTNCDASGPSPVTEGLTNGYPVATMTVTCTKGRVSGMGGLVAVKAIRGAQALYVIQRVWRGPAFERNEVAPVPEGMLKEWSSFLRAVSVCDIADSTRHPCPK